MMLRLLTQFLALYLGGVPVCAQTTGATHLLTRGPGAEAAALGSAIVPVVHDPTALYWNPAGLAGAGGAVTGEHLFLMDGARYDFVGLSVPSRFGTFGLGALQLSRSNIVARSAIDDPGSPVANSQSDYLVGFGRPVTQHWTAGVTANILDFNVAGFKDKGFGVDAGAQGAYPQESFWGFKRVVWSFGAAIKNLVEPRITLLSDTEAFPRELRGGVGLSFQTASRASSAGIVNHDRALIVLSARRAAGDGLHPGIGLSYDFQDALVARLGFDGAVSAGVGLHTMDGKFVVDYAVENRPLSFNHRFSISYRFLAPKVKSMAVYREEVDEEYVRAKGQAEALAGENTASARKLFVEQRYGEAQEPFRLAALLLPENAEGAADYRRAVEAFRRAEIRRLGSESAPEPGQEAKALDAIVRMLDLGAEDAPQLARRARHIAGSLQPEEAARLTRAAFEERAAVADRLTGLGHIEEASAIETALDLTASTETASAVAALRQKTEAKADDIRRELSDASSEPGRRLARAALAVRRAFPSDTALQAKAEAALARCRAERPASVRERFYLLKLYYLAAVRYARKTDDGGRQAADLLAEILRRDPANADADTLLDAIARDGLARQ